MSAHPVISTDSHVTEDPDTYPGFIDEARKEKAE